ncbi:MAG: hypothetical protein K8R88_13570, partial [Armatimonadetes bacterium]|nr:hypothetical protein [Armatimonadota bacterium]
SQTFIVRVAGTYGNTTLYREVTIELGTTEPKMTQITRPFGDNLLSRWGWQEEPLTDVTLAEAS